MMPISKDWEKFGHLFAREEISAKTLLLQEGQIAKTIFLIEKGCLRSWFNNDGKEVTFQFFFEGQGVSSIESFITNEPSLFNRLVAVGDKAAKTAIFSADKAFFMWNSRAISHKKNAVRRENGVFTPL